MKGRYMLVALLGVAVLVVGSERFIRVHAKKTFHAHQTMGAMADAAAIALELPVQVIDAWVADNGQLEVDVLWSRLSQQAFRFSPDHPDFLKLKGLKNGDFVCFDYSEKPAGPSDVAGSYLRLNRTEHSWFRPSDNSVLPLRE